MRMAMKSRSGTNGHLGSVGILILSFGPQQIQIRVAWGSK